MDQDLKARWIAALRSGKYSQGQGRLKLGDCYCCLGVLCQVAGISIDEQGNSANNNGYKPIENLVEYDLTQLYAMNDGTRHHKDIYSFAEIADWIEINL